MGNNTSIYSSSIIGVSSSCNWLISKVYPVFHNIANIEKKAGIRLYEAFGKKAREAVIMKACGAGKEYGTVETSC